ncbi:hypothetical protein GCM10007891_09990 [Methylophaga thalassica]|uniref:Uncharacterized protein n=1 Tax=Methylophaga thalassica TaxID=40223 RepID=A0ABQ5TTS1_9GAMM|nr:hypothetical protein GCM10007891_09990 [Methylophaga thalassica]
MFLSPKYVKNNRVIESIILKEHSDDIKCRGIEFTYISPKIDNIDKSKPINIAFSLPFSAG